MKNSNIERLIELNDLITRNSVELSLVLENEIEKKERSETVKVKNNNNKFKINLYINDKRTTVTLSKSLLNLFFKSTLKLIIDINVKEQKEFITKYIKQIVEINNTQVSDSVNKTEEIEEILIGLISDSVK